MGAFLGLILFRMNIPFFLSLIFSAIGTAAFAFLLLKTIYDPILRISGGFSVRGLTFVVAGFGMSNILQNTYWVAWGVVSQSYGATFGNGISIGTLTVQPLSLIHISEPTRQAEISYAVFCLKKKKTETPY